MEFCAMTFSIQYKRLVRRLAGSAKDALLSIRIHITIHEDHPGHLFSLFLILQSLKCFSPFLYTTIKFLQIESFWKHGFADIEIIFQIQMMSKWKIRRFSRLEAAKLCTFLPPPRPTDG